MQSNEVVKREPKTENMRKNGAHLSKTNQCQIVKRWRSRETGAEGRTNTPMPTKSEMRPKRGKLRRGERRKIDRKTGQRGEKKKIYICIYKERLSERERKNTGILSGANFQSRRQETQIWWPWTISKTRGCEKIEIVCVWWAAVTAKEHSKTKAQKPRVTHRKI